MSAAILQIMVSPNMPTATIAAAEAGIHCLSLPTPFAAAAVNVYLIEDEPLTLVDCGPNSASALDALERMLGEHWRTIDDIELVVVTHQHMSHLGLAATVARRAGAQIACLDALAPHLEDWTGWSAAEDDFARDLMLRHGVDAGTAETLRSIARMVRGWGAPVTVDRRLAAGDDLGLAGRTLRVLPRAGHSPSDTIFHDEEHGIAITGDHLLGGPWSNALLSLPLGCSPADAPPPVRPRPLVDYRASLRATRGLEIDVALGGHGAPIVDHLGFVDERLRRQDERAEALLALLGGGRRSAWELAVALWPNTAITQAYRLLSEVLGHLDLLIDAGLVVEHDAGPVTTFEPT